LASDVVAILVETGGQANRIRELEAHDLDRAGGDIFGDQAGEAGGVEEIDAIHADTMGSFGVEGEKELANEGIEHSGSGFYRIWQVP
jgi:hypothetical protein